MTDDEDSSNAVRSGIDLYIKGDLALRPIFHQNQARVEAHIFVSFWPIACA
jgi:hypothetical protein